MANPVNAQGQYNSATPVLKNQDTIPLQLDSAGNLMVNTAVGGGGGGPVTMVDGGNVTQGALADAAITTNATGSLSGKLRGIVAILSDIWDSVNHRIKVDGSGVTQPVSGTLTAVTAITNPLPAGTNVIGHVVVDTAPSTAVTGTFFQGTQPVSAVSLPLPTGAALEAGGNLAAIAASEAATASQTRNDAQITDVLNQILAQLQILNVNFAACTTGSIDNPDAASNNFIQ